MCQPVALEPNGTQSVLSDQPGLIRAEGCPMDRGRACVITPITLLVMTRKSHNSAKRDFDVTRIAIQESLGAASGRSLSRDVSLLHIAHAYDVSLLHIAHAYSAIIAMCDPCGYPSLDLRTRADINTASLNMTDDVRCGSSKQRNHPWESCLSRMYTFRQGLPWTCV